MSKQIIVAGSLNMDFVVQVPRLPAHGETLTGHNFQMIPGGKGANQAYAAGRMGGKVKLLGRVGNDVFGEQQRASLKAAGVDTSCILSSENRSTGVALIFVENGGQNMIVIDSGANAELLPADLKNIEPFLEPGGYMLMQLETPLETIAAAAKLAQARAMITILDPAPARPLPPDLLSNIDLLTPNETEDLVLLGKPAHEISVSEAGELANELLKLGPKQVIIKLGAKGAWWSDGRSGEHFAAPKVKAVDATAAGDTFNGALAAALCEGLAMKDAIPFANKAAALSVANVGAQASIPTRRQVDNFK